MRTPFYICQVAELGISFTFPPNDASVQIYEDTTKFVSAVLICLFIGHKFELLYSASRRLSS